MKTKITFAVYCLIYSVYGNRMTSEAPDTTIQDQLELAQKFNHDNNDGEDGCPEEDFTGFEGWYPPGFFQDYLFPRWWD